MTTGVVIGDSIVQGIPNSSRVCQGTTIQLNPATPNLTGQISTEISKKTGFFWYNMGITGQYTSHIWNRWNRDVLAQLYNPGDAIGLAQTIPQKPDYLILHVGVNDISNNVAIATIESNYTNMFTSCASNNIKLIVCNIPNNDAWNSTQRANANTVNTWIANNLNTLCPGAKIFDEYSFCLSKANNTKCRYEYYPDGLHPYGGNADCNGYSMIGRKIYDIFLTM